jgi:hypothetical protein
VSALLKQRNVSLVEALDRVLGRGAVVAGDIVISVAEVDLIRLHLQLVLGSTGALEVSAEEKPGVPAGGPDRR